MWLSGICDGKQVATVIAGNKTMFLYLLIEVTIMGAVKWNENARKAHYQKEQNDQIMEINKN